MGRNKASVKKPRQKRTEKIILNTKMVVESRNGGNKYLTARGGWVDDINKAKTHTEYGTALLKAVANNGRVIKKFK